MNNHKMKLAMRVARKLDDLKLTDPALAEILTLYITVLRAENARYRARSRDKG